MGVAVGVVVALFAVVAGSLAISQAQNARFATSRSICQRVGDRRAQSRDDADAPYEVGFGEVVVRVESVGAPKHKHRCIAVSARYVVEGGPDFQRVEQLAAKKQWAFERLWDAHAEQLFASCGPRSKLSAAEGVVRCELRELKDTQPLDAAIDLVARLAGFCHATLQELAMMHGEAKIDRGPRGLRLRVRNPSVTIAPSTLGWTFWAPCAPDFEGDATPPFDAATFGPALGPKALQQLQAAAPDTAHATRSKGLLLTWHRVPELHELGSALRTLQALNAPPPAGPHR